MNQYIDWFNTTLQGGVASVIHAGIAHLYFELIHPFEDGNGNLGRKMRIM